MARERIHITCRLLAYGYSARVSMGPITSALALAVAHKVVLLAALFTSSFTWDTSSILVLQRSNGSRLLKALASRVMIWDSVYYIADAFRGIEYEHEYAFSPYWARIIRLLSPEHTIAALALTASAVSLISHVLAVVLLFKFSSRYMPLDAAFRAAWLYILSPAGIFLVSGYPESSVAALSFVGLLLSSKRYFILAGVCFAMATLLRANGLFWGLVFLVALFSELARGERRIGNIVGIIVGGSLVGAAFVLPQAVAYISWCPGLEWCDKTIPSIYSYIQSKYWDQGLFHYWVPANIPNFLLGMPTLILLVQSSRLLWRRGLYDLAGVQMTMAIITFFFWHIQVVTRIASCVPGPYWYISELLGSTNAARKRQGKLWAAYFGVWGVTQAALFGAFLPPA